MGTESLSRSRRLEDLCVTRWIAPDLWAHFTATNSGKEPVVLRVVGRFEDTCLKLEEALQSVDDTELVCVLLHSSLCRDGAGSRLDHRLVIDQASFLKQRYIKFWHGKVDYGEYQLELGFSFYADRGTVHIHTVSFGKGRESKWRGRGLMSRTFGNLVKLIEQYYAGYDITAVTVSGAGEHWFRKYFQAERLASQVERLSVKEYVFVGDHNSHNLMRGKIRREPKTE